MKRHFRFTHITTRFWKNTYSGSYSIMDVMDIDTDNYKELITITNSPASNNAAAAIFSRERRNFEHQQY